MDLISLSVAKKASDRADSVQEQLNQAVLDGDQLAETQQARVDAKGKPHPTLKARADSEYTELQGSINSNHNTVMTQLAEKANHDDLDETNETLSLKADKTEVNALATGKADRAYVDSMLNDISPNQINKNKGKFDQTYMTDEFLQQIAGDTPINAVVADGGVTKEKLADSSVDVAKTSFLEFATTNLFNRNDVEVGKAIQSNGQIVTDQGYILTGFIPIKPSTRYTSTQMSSRVFFGGNKQYIEGRPSSEGNSTLSPVNARYIRYSIQNTANALNEGMFVEGASLPSSYYPYGKFYDVSFQNIKFSSTAFEFLGDSLEAKKIADEVVTPTKTTFLESFPQYKNLFNKLDAEVGKAIQATGAVVSDGNYIATGFIPIKPSTSYTSGKMRTRVFFDEKKQYIEGRSSSEGITTFSPANARYIRYSINNVAGALDTEMLVEGTKLPTDYRPHGMDVVAFKNVHFLNSPFESKLKNKKWNALGDSITFAPNVVSYHEQIANKTGCSVRNYGITGSTVSTSGGGQNPMVLRYGEMDDDADIITVFGGVNDTRFNYNLVIGDIESADISTFYGAYNVLLEGLINKYPNKTIATITPLQHNDANRDNLLTGVVAKAVREVSVKYGIPCLDLYGSGAIAGRIPASLDAMTSDKLHPNTFGHTVIAGKVLSFLESNMPI